MPRLQIVPPSGREITPPSIQSQTPGADQFGAGIGRALVDASGVFGRIQEAYDQTSMQLLKGEGEKSLAGTLADAKIKFSNPEEYKAYLDKSIPDVVDTTLDKAPNNQVRRQLEASLSTAKAQAEINAKYGYYEKQKDGALANALEIENNLINKAIAAPDAQTRQDVSNQYAAMLGQLHAANFIDADKMEARLIKFQDKVIGGAMALDAKQDPLGFTDKVKAGAYPGASLTQIQQATDIADKRLHELQVADEKYGKEQSAAAERSYEEQAGQRKMDIDQMRADAKRFGWSDDKINGLINMQIGLKVANPYEKQLIEDALDPLYRNAVPTMNDVRDAEANLKRHAKNREISTITPDYRAAMQHIQGVYNNIRIQGEVATSRAESKDTHSESNARRDISDLYGKYFAGKVTPKIQAEIKTHYRNLEPMDMNERRQYVKDLESKLDKQFKDRQNPNVHINELRGLKKDK